MLVKEEIKVRVIFAFQFTRSVFSYKRGEKTFRIANKYFVCRKKKRAQKIDTNLSIDPDSFFPLLPFVRRQFRFVYSENIRYDLNQ